jgi:hypothetical protein
MAPTSVNLTWYATEAALSCSDLSAYNRATFVKGVKKAGIPINDFLLDSVRLGDVDGYFKVAQEMWIWYKSEDSGSRNYSSTFNDDNEFNQELYPRYTDTESVNKISDSSDTYENIQTGDTRPSSPRKTADKISDLVDTTENVQIGDTRPSSARKTESTDMIKNIQTVDTNKLRLSSARKTKNKLSESSQTIVVAASEEKSGNTLQCHDEAEFEPSEISFLAGVRWLLLESKKSLLSNGMDSNHLCIRQINQMCADLANDVPIIFHYFLYKLFLKNINLWIESDHTCNVHHNIRHN